MKLTGVPVRRTVNLAMGLLVAANLLLVGSLVVLLGTDILRSSPGHPEQASPTPSASVDLMPMGLAHIPTSNACVLCHQGGGSAGLKTVPALGHPLEGWRQCLTCHGDAKLARLAPGHDGIAESECLNCHKIARPGQAITMPHLRLQDSHCLDCHGTYAHLPSSMASRKETSCTLCHKPADLPPPQYPHPLNEERSCRQCHKSPEVGNLPIDHALRTDSTCLLCHDIKTAENGPSALPRKGASEGTSGGGTSGGGTSGGGTSGGLGPASAPTSTAQAN